MDMDEDHREECCNTGLALALTISQPFNSTGGKCSPATANVSFNLFPKQEEEDKEFINKHRKSSSSTDGGGDDGRRRIENYSGRVDGGGRKKLRLTKDQSALLENTFNLHTTLTQAQKQALAERLNLTPRQVEVWFQNRRARTKLKQTEVDCEYLKKCCESLTNENRKLKKQLMDLRLGCGYSPPPELVMCRSCQKRNGRSSSTSRRTG